MSDHEALLELIAIQELMAQYCHAHDAQDSEIVASLYQPTAGWVKLGAAMQCVAGMWTDTLVRLSDAVM